MESVSLGPQPKFGAANRWHYNITLEPTNFDFLVWLATCELIRRREGAPAPLRIGFSINEDQSLLSQKTKDHRSNWFANIMAPSMEFFGAIVDPECVTNGRQSNIYTIREIVKAAKAGEAIPQLEPPPAARDAVKHFLDGRQPIVITLRETGTWEHRNSNMTAWLGFAVELLRQGEDVLIVRDTLKADNSLPDFDTYPMASKDLHIRAALYEQAKCNFFVSNGPAFLAHMGTRPWITFVTVNEDEPDPVNRPDWWIKNQGIAPGEQFPWSSPVQRFIWAEDTYENIVAAWNELKHIGNGSLALSHNLEARP
jgi:hypothetical protein